MKRYFFSLFFLIVLNSIPVLVFTEANREKADNKSMSIKEKDGLRFRVPEDWPVEKRAGAVAPIPTEEYLSLKFKSVETRLTSIEETLKQFEQLLQGLRDIKKELEDVKKRQEEVK